MKTKKRFKEKRKLKDNSKRGQVFDYYIPYGDARSPIPQTGGGGPGGPGGAGLSVPHFGKFCHLRPYGAELRSRIFWVPGPQGQGRIPRALGLSWL